MNKLSRSFDKNLQGLLHGLNYNYTDFQTTGSWTSRKYSVEAI